MAKLMVIPNQEDISDFMNYADAFLFGIEKMSVHMPFYISIDQVERYTKEIKKNKKKIFISLNKNIQNEDLEKLESLLIQLGDLNIDGIFYYDVAVLNIKKRLGLQIPLVWSAEHLTTNYATIEFWKNQGIDYTYVSSEITLREILEIRQHTNCKLIVPIFGYLPIFTSKRHTVKNYLEQFHLQDSSDIHYLHLKEEDYPILDDELGTTIYSAHILNGYHEYLALEDIEYVTLNSFEIPSDKFLEIVKMYFEKNPNHEEKINQMFLNADKGFLHKETIYKVKRHD